MRHLLLLSFGVLLAVVAASAQQQGLYLGAAGGYSFGVPLTVTRDPGIVNRYYGVQLEGTSTDHLGWAGISMRTPDLFSKHLGLSADISLSLSAGSFSSREFAFDSLHVPAGWVHGLYTVELSTLLSMLQLDMQAQYQLSDRVSVGFGPWFTARLSSGIFQQENLVGTKEPDIDLGDIERTRTIAAGKPLASGVFRWGGIVSLSYAIPLAQGMMLVANPHLRIDGPGLVDNLGLRAVRGGLSASLLFDVSGREALAAPPEIMYVHDTVHIAQEPPPVAAPPVPKPVLEAEIKLYSRDDNNSRSSQVVLRRISTYYKQSSELSPVVFFDSNSVALPDRYNRVGAENAASFSPRMLAPLTPLKAYYHVLNIIGMRLKEHPASRITLTGSVSKGEPRRLAQARCETIEAYFREVWMVDQSRIDIRSSSGDTESRSVSISSSTAALLTPFVSEWKVRELDAPAIRLAHSVKAAAGVRNWELVLTHNGKRVGYHSGTSLQELDDLDLSFQIDGGVDKSKLDALHAEFTVEDYTGGSVISYAELPLIWEETPATIPVPESNRENVSAVLFPSADDTRPEKNNVLNTLLASVRNGAYITIASLVRGEPTDEQRLLRPDRVAETVLSSLKLRDIQIAELHIQRQVDNIPTSIRDFPESNLFRLAVCVTVEQGKE